MSDKCPSCGFKKLVVTEEMLNDETWQHVEAMWKEAFASVEKTELEKARHSNAQLLLKLNDVVGMYDAAMERYPSVCQENYALTERVARLEAGE